MARLLETLGERDVPPALQLLDHFALPAAFESRVVALANRHHLTLRKLPTLLFDDPKILSSLLSMLARRARRRVTRCFR